MISFTVTAMMALLLSFAIYRIFDIRPSSTPVVSLSLICNITMVFAMFGLLKLGVTVAFAVCILAFAVCVLNKKYTASLTSFLTPSVTAMFIAAFAMALILNSRSPMINWWDEFSFWGMSAKLIKERGRLYTFYRSSMIGASTPPALPVLTYVFHAFSGQFTEWLQFAAYDFLILACICSVAGFFDDREKHMGVAVLVSGFMAVFMFRASGRISSVSPVYITAYSEIPLAMLFTRSVATGFCNREKGAGGVLTAAPVLMMLVFTKDMGFALGMIAVFILAFELLTLKTGSGSEKDTLTRKVLYIAVLAAVVVISFFSWSFHMSSVMDRNPFELGGETNYSMVQLMVNGIGELLGIISPSAKFVEIRREMIDAIFHYRISLLGSGAVLTVFITALFVLAFLTSEKKRRISIASVYITSFIGFIGYYIFHLFIYVYIFKDNAYGLVSYDRYMQIYFVAWIMIAVLCLSLSCISEKRKGALARRAGIVIRVFFTLLPSCYLSYDNTFLRRDRTAFSNRLNVSSKVEKIRDVVGDEDVIICFTNDEGGRWFIYAYELSGNYVIPDQGLLAPSDEDPNERIKEVFDRYGVTHVLLDNSSKELEDLYGDLFDTQIGRIGLDAVAYFEVVRDDEGRIYLKNIKEVLSVADQN